MFTGSTPPPPQLHVGDLPADITFGPTVAVDTETMGLNPARDRLCLVQLSSGDGTSHLVQIPKGQYEAPNLVRLLSDPATLKLFHFARFDVAVLKAYLGVQLHPVYCTKVASKLVRTYTDRHGLKDLCRDLLGVEISKQQQTSDWGAEILTSDQQRYAAGDVLYLHALKHQLDILLAREDRTHIAQACFDFLPIRGELDLGGWDDPDIFSH
ncbi:ribonuclease H-like domain-containing protein [Fodinicurvata sp. EGI_FJ10296]|uniref:ribonuclease D n=1 Tax=Fodinicurvata sp. EGI_FJ10296 TaxID=3231908 RepID=UPI003456DE4E